MHIPTLIRTRIEHVRNARRSRADIERRQLLKFRRLVRYVNDRSPYYRDLIGQRRINVETCVPADFPELTKAELIDQFDRIVTDRSITKARVAAFLERSHDAAELLDGQHYVVYTSGTSGAPGYLVYSRQDWARGMAHTLRINPPSFGRRRLAYFAWATGHPAGATFATSSQSWPLSLVYQIALFHMNQPIASVVQGLNEFRPAILMGYPSTLMVLAEEQRRGSLHIQPQWIQSSGEPIGGAGREQIQSAFGVALTNVYSCTEHLLMGFSRPEFEGMYLFEDDLIFDLEPDRTVITNLFNFTTPLIRYCMTDVLTPKPDTVGTFPFTKVAEVVGRGELAAIFTNRYGADDVIAPGKIYGVATRGVRGFQVHIQSKTACALHVCLEPELEEPARASAVAALRQEFDRLLAQKDMQNVRVTVETVAELTRDARSGKFRTVVHAPQFEKVLV